MIISFRGTKFCDAFKSSGIYPSINYIQNRKHMQNRLAKLALVTLAIDIAVASRWQQPAQTTLAENSVFNKQ